MGWKPAPDMTCCMKDYVVPVNVATLVSTNSQDNTNIAIGKDARTISSPKLSFYDWYYQKKRHLTTGKHYKFLHLFILGIWDISTILFFSTAIILLSLQAQIITITIVLAIRLLSQLIITKKTMLLLGEKKLLLISPLLEILILVLNPLISIASIFTKKRKW